MKLHRLRPASLPLVFALLLALAAAGALAALAAPPPAARRPLPRKPATAAPRTATPARPAGASPTLLAEQAREREDELAYARAAATLKELRALVPPDADLEVALALDEARSGATDSAWARLHSPILEAALADSTHSNQWHPIGPGRDRTWINGRFDGWYWTIARARAELALRLRRWDEAVAAAHVATRAFPLSGRDHLLLAVAAGRAGDAALAREESSLALGLDPTLPEAYELRGLWAWRDGDRALARRCFVAAIERDSVARTAALSLVRLANPAAKPDSLPDRFLSGGRRATALIPPIGPKLVETLPMDQIPGLYGGLPTLKLGDEDRARMQLASTLSIEASALVDESGRALAVEFPYLPPARISPLLMHRMMELSEHWRFKPAVRSGHAARVWINVEYSLQP